MLQNIRNNTIDQDTYYTNLYNTSSFFTYLLGHCPVRANADQPNEEPELNFRLSTEMFLISDHFQQLHDHVQNIVFIPYSYRNQDMEPLIQKLLQDVYRRCVNDDDIAIQEKYNTQDPKLVHYILYCLYYKVPETQLDQILQNVMLHLKEELQKPEYSDIKQLPIFSDHQLYYFDYFKLITTDNKEKKFLLIEEKEYLKLLQEQPVLPYILGHFGLELGYGTFFYILPNNLEEIQDFLEKYCTSEFSPGLREYATHNNPLMLQVIDDISNTLIGSDKEKIAQHCNILPTSVRLRHYVRYLSQNQELSVDEILAKIILAIQNHPNYDKTLPIFEKLEDFRNIIGKDIKNDDNLAAANKAIPIVSSGNIISNTGPNAETSANQELPKTDTTIAPQNKPPQKGVTSANKGVPIVTNTQLYYTDMRVDKADITADKHRELLQEQPVLPYILGHFGVRFGYGTVFYILPNNLEEIQNFLEKYCTSEFSPGLREYATHNNPLMLQVIDDISNTLIGSDKEKIAQHCNILPTSVRLRHYVRYLSQNQELSVDEILAKIILAIQNHPNYDQKLPIFAQLEDFKNIIGKNIKNDNNLTSANKELPKTDTTIASQNKSPQKGVTFGFNLESILKIFKFIIIGLATLGLAVGSYIGFFK